MALKGMGMHKALTVTEHRPWPVPNRPWVMTQTWSELLFAHWAVSPDLLEAHLPKGLSLERFNGQAWLGIVPFRMSRIHPRWLPSLPWISAFLELNVRTYVTDGEKSGVWFFSLDAANPVGVWLGRNWFNLPYFNAQMHSQKQGGGYVYRSERRHMRADSGVFSGSYQPVSAEFLAQPDTLEHFLTERYCLYTQDKQGRLYRGEIHHVPWPLQPAEAEIITNTVAPFDLPPTPPLLHYAERIEVVVWPLVQLG